MNNKELSLANSNPIEQNKIKTPCAYIITTGSAEKPYFEIKYYDLNDNSWHVGYSSYNLKYVYEWLEKYFDIIDDFSRYGFIMMDKSENEMNHNEYYFEIGKLDKLFQFMNIYNISPDQFNNDDVEEDDSFSGLDFQLSVYKDGNYNLEFGPIYCNSVEESLTTTDIVSCKIDGLSDYLYSLIEK